MEGARSRPHALTRCFEPATTSITVPAWPPARAGTAPGAAQQQVAVDLIVTLERSTLAGTRQRPELATALEHASRFQLVAFRSNQVKHFSLNS